MKELRFSVDGSLIALFVLFATPSAAEASAISLPGLADRDRPAAEWVGTVVADADGAPIASAQVRLLDADGALLTVRMTDDQGRFAMPLPGPGVYSLEARRIGFEATPTEPRHWDGEAQLEIEIRMVHRPIELEAVEVEGYGAIRPRQLPTYDGLYYRREDARPVGRDRVYIREDLEAMALDHLKVWEFVRRQRVPGMVTAGMMPTSRDGRAPAGTRTGCMPTFILGTFDAPMEVDPFSPMEYERLLEMPMGELEGIELYGGPSGASADPWRMWGRGPLAASTCAVVGVSYGPYHGTRWRCVRRNDSGALSPKAKIRSRPRSALGIVGMWHEAPRLQTRK